MKRTKGEKLRKYEQSFCEALGKWGCYLFCIIDIATEITGKKYNSLNVAENAIDKGYIFFNKDNYLDLRNFDILRPDLILSMLTGKKISVKKTNPDYKLQKNEYMVELWSVNGKDGHFARTHIGFNSLQKSNCVNNGKVIGYRIFKIEG